MEFNINYKAAAKKAGIAAVIIAVLGGAGAWYHHSQEQALHLQQQQARTALVTAQASERSLSLLDENTIRSITAEAIGQDETAITFKQIALMNAADVREPGNKDKGKDKKDGDRRDKHEKGPQKDEQGGPRDQGPQGQGPQGPEDLPQPSGNESSAARPAQGPKGPDGMAPQQGAHTPDFRPVYRVNCNVGNVRYHVEIDAVSGKVIRASV